MINIFFANGNFVNNSHGVGRRTWHPSAEQLEHLASSATIPSTATGAALYSCLAQFLFNSSQPVSPRPTAPSGLLGPPWCYDCKGVSKLRTKCAIVRTAILWLRFGELRVEPVQSATSSAHTGLVLPNGCRIIFLRM
ncbi:hypothetical protein PS2_006033 [Malus domestica]